MPFIAVNQYIPERMIFSLSASYLSHLSTIGSFVGRIEGSFVGSPFPEPQPARLRHQYLMNSQQ